jgi:hypothetical protein
MQKVLILFFQEVKCDVIFMQAQYKTPRRQEELQLGIQSSPALSCKRNQCPIEVQGHSYLCESAPLPSAHNTFLVMIEHMYIPFLALPSHPNNHLHSHIHHMYKNSKGTSVINVCGPFLPAYFVWT